MDDLPTPYEFPSHHPYYIRIGAAPTQGRPLYEVYNKETGMVEDVQAILGNAIRAARMYKTLLLEEMDTLEKLGWPDDNEDGS